MPEGEGAARLAAKVGGILERIEAELDDVDARIGERLHVLDMDNDGLISKGELEIALGFMRVGDWPGLFLSFISARVATCGKVSSST